MMKDGEMIELQNATSIAIRLYLHYMHHCSPAAECVTINRTQEALREHFEQFIGILFGKGTGENDGR